VKETLTAQRRNAETFELLGRVIVIVKRLTERLPPLLTKKFFAVPFVIAVLSATPVLVKVCVAVAKTFTEPETTVRTLFEVAFTAAFATTGGWVSASMNAPTTAATRDADLFLLLISLSFHQLFSVN
jgi:hypothetical protein